MEVTDGNNKRKEDRFVTPRVEIDTSAPFESVKEAATRFGGFGFWKPTHRHHQAAASATELPHNITELDTLEVEKQKAQLRQELITEERETLDVLKELEYTKRLAGELKVRLQKELMKGSEGFKTHEADRNAVVYVSNPDVALLDRIHPKLLGSSTSVQSSSPELILMELDRAKSNLFRTAEDSSETQASIHLLSMSIEEERNSLEMTCQRVATNSRSILSLEEDLKQTKQKLQLVKGSTIEDSSIDATNLSKEVLLLKSETDEFKKMGEAALSEFYAAMLDIEQTKSRIKIAEMSLAAVNKMKEETKAAEAAALSELKLLTNSESSTGDELLRPKEVVLTQDEYYALVAKARDAKELSKKRVINLMQEVDEANISKMKTLRKLDEATEEVKMTKILLDNALSRVEAATAGKVAVEEGLRQWRSEHSQKRRSLNNSTKFKTVGPSQCRKEPRLLDVNGISLTSDDSVPVLRPTLSIGQILSNKLYHLDENESEISTDKRVLKRNESLGQMLNRRDEKSGNPISAEVEEKVRDHKQSPRKSNKLLFTRFPLRLASQSRKKKTVATPRFMMGDGQFE